MRSIISNPAVLLAIVAGTLVACEVDQVEEGEMPDIDASYEEGNLPEYDVDVRKTEEGKMPDVDIDAEGGNLPEYDVDGPNIDIGTEEKTITVPDIDVEMDDDEHDADEEH